MPTPVESVVANVNDSSVNKLFLAVANNTTATDSLLGSNRNLDAVGSNAEAARGLGLNGGDDDILRRALCRRTGRTPANFPDTATDIIQDGTFRGEIFGDASLSGLISGSQPGMAEIASSATFSSEMSASQAAMPLVAASQTAMQEVAASQTAMQEVAVSQIAMQEVAPSQTAMIEIGNSATARAEVYASETALSEIRPVDQAIAKLSAGEVGANASNFPDMATLAGNATVMQGVAASQTAMQEVAASLPALPAIANDPNVQNTVYNNNTAVTALDNSPFVESNSAEIEQRNSFTLKGDRVILLSHDDGIQGGRANNPDHGANRNSFPHTAGRIKRNSSTNSSDLTTTSAQFIDI